MTADQSEDVDVPVVRHDRCTICDTTLGQSEPNFSYGGFPLCPEDVGGMVSWLLDGGTVDDADPEESNYAWLAHHAGEPHIGSTAGGDE